MESEHVKATIEFVKITPEVKHEDETPFTEGKNREVSSPSSSSSGAYGDEKGLLHNSPVEPDFDGNFSPLPEPVFSPVMVSPSPLAENGMQNSSPEPTEMKSPPIQTMEQPPGYDPNRIPASIFSTKTGNPTEWSATSNESLFSIHMGNNSFSRDYAILFGNGKSGELPKLDDWNGSQSNPFMLSGDFPRLNEWDNSQSKHHHVSEAKSNEFGSLPPVMEAPSQEESSLPSGEFSRIEKKDDNLSPKFISAQTVEYHGKENSAECVNLPTAKKPPLPETNHNSSSNYPLSSPSPTRLSDASGHSGSSFAFPVLASHDSGKNELAKVAPEKPEKPERDEQPKAQPQAPVSQETPTNVSGTRWFPCFSCWPRFC